MAVSTSFLVLSLAIFARGSPIHVVADDEGNQVLFAASTKVLHPPTASLVTAQLPVPSAARTQAAPTSDPSVGTSVWFSPDVVVPTPPSHSAGDKPLRPIVAVYYPDWTASKLPPEQVDFARIDWVDFAFAVPDAVNNTPKFLEDNSEDLLHRLVAAAHARNKKVKLSIGGWTGSGHFSEAVNATNRNAFAQDILGLYNRFALDGIDIDWEYPGEQGADGNVHSPSDNINFLAFLRLLRTLLPPHACITAATQVWPFVDASGQHMMDVSSFAKVLDWILLMNYDVWSSSPTPGPNAPLSDGCHNSTQPAANAHAALASWTTAGFPARQIMLGLPAYGYVSRSTARTLRTRRAERASFEREPISATDVLTTPGKTDSPTASIVTVMSEAGSAEAGQVQFNALIAQGALARDANGSFIGAGGFTRNWDTCSSTPFLRSEATQQIVTYDDPASLGMKAAYVREAGMLGVNMWDAHGDTAGWDMVDGIRRGFGFV